MDPLLRHIARCNDAELPGGRVELRLGADAIGWLPADFAATLLKLPGFSDSAGAVVLPAEAAPTLPAIARDLAGRGEFRHRGEAFDVWATAGGPVLAHIDRGAIERFGLQALGVHLNGLVRRPATAATTGWHVWVARRAADKPVDPGKLDHLVAGGVPAGLGAWDTLIKEAGEEAGLSPELAAQAVEVARLRYAMARPRGLARDTTVCYDLTLPEDFVPIPADGEVESFELWPVEEVLDRVRRTDDFKFNVNLVLIDLFLRLGLVDGAVADAMAGVRC